MVDQTGKVTLIDFPQMVSTGHANASDLFARDMNGLVKFFAMKMHYVPDADQVLRLEDIPVIEAHIDEEVRASGFAPSPEEEGQLVGFLHATAAAAAEGEEPEDDEDGEEEEGDEDEEQEQEQEQEQEDSGAPPSSVFPSLEAAHAPADDDVSELDGDEEAAMLGSLAGGAAPLAAEDLERVREQARYNLHRRGGRGGGSGFKKPSRNHTKERNKYGKVVRPEKLDAEW
jgi:RIO kinase 2